MSDERTLRNRAAVARRWERAVWWRSLGEVLERRAATRQAGAGNLLAAYRRCETATLAELAERSGISPKALRSSGLPAAPAGPGRPRGGPAHGAA